jgi:ACS family tartrate transporter-like MFS transporter
LYLVEGLPAVLATLLVLKFITDKPSEAEWLTPSEKLWLAQELESDSALSDRGGQKTGLVRTLFKPTIIALALIWFFNTGANLGLSFFLPQVIKLHGFSTQNVGWISAIPYVAGCLGMLLCGYLSDKLQAPRALVIVPTILICVGFAIAGFLPGSNIAIAGLAFAAIGILGAKGPFWVVCAANMDRSTAAGAIAFVNAIGNLGGLVGPVVLGYLRDRSEDFSSGLYALSLSAVITLILIAIFLKGPPRPSSAVAKTA